MSHVPPAADPPDPEDKAATTSLGDLLSEVTRDISTLMRQEVELARAELQQSATRAGKAAGMYAAAGVAGLLMLSFLSVALWWGLGYLMGNAWAAVIVAVIWAIIALVLYLQGKKAMESVRGMPKTVDSLKQIPETLKRDEAV